MIGSFILALLFSDCNSSHCGKHKPYLRLIIQTIYMYSILNNLMQWLTCITCRVAARDFAPCSELGLSLL